MYLQGIIELAATFLSIVAGIIGSTVFFQASKKKEYAPWKPLSIVLILFAFEEIFGALKSFGIYSTPWITHVLPSVILGFLIYALVLQILAAEGKL